MNSEIEQGNGVNIEVEYLIMDEFLNILREENAYLLNQLLIDWRYLCEERSIETSVSYI